MALATLDDAADLERFEREVEALAPPPEEVGEGATRVHGAACLVECDLAEASGDTAAAIVDGLVVGRAEGWSLWSTTGSERVRPSMIAAGGLPPIEGFAAFLDGQWERWGWMTP